MAKILNYTTTIAANKTIGQIQEALVGHGVREIHIEYDPEGAPAALTFLISTDGRSVPFRLPANHEGVYRVLCKGRMRTTSRSKDLHAQARRVAWRIVKNWIDAQMAMVQAEVAQLPQVFLPYAVMQDNRTLFEHVASSPRFMLPEKSSVRR